MTDSVCMRTFESKVAMSAAWDGGGSFLGSSQTFWDAPSSWKEVVSPCTEGQEVGAAQLSHSIRVAGA